MASKEFNVAGLCLPAWHYMVNIDAQLIKIRDLVDRGKYFTINRARQYGKTTTLRALFENLKNDYLVVSMDFQKIGAVSFADELVFAAKFALLFTKSLEGMVSQDDAALLNILKDLRSKSETTEKHFSLTELFICIRSFCEAANKKVILIVDEVDSASNNQVFLDFLAQLRAYYLERDLAPTFYSVILAGVYDIKNLRAKIRPEDEHKRNSPWNIAADFNVDMSLPEAGIAGMLSEYEEDHQTGMNVNQIAAWIYDYTSGYPFLVSRICKLIDEKIAGSDEYPDKSSAWTKQGFDAAIHCLVGEANPLFESLTGKLINYPVLNKLLKELLFKGESQPYNPWDPDTEVAEMFGFIKKKNGSMAITNRIFETILYDHFLSEEAKQGRDIHKASTLDRNKFIVDGYLDMRLVLTKFVNHFNDLYKNDEESFIEDVGRKYFLLYLRPIINGVGNYYIEAQTRDRKQTDVIVDYRGERYIIEMKIWRGDEYNKRGEQQLVDYLDFYRIDKGYMLSFCFNKNKKIGVHEVVIGDKVIIEAVV